MTALKRRQVYYTGQSLPPPFWEMLRIGWCNSMADPGFPRRRGGEGATPDFRLKTYYYRPQRSCSKVMFLHLSVIHPDTPRQTPAPLDRPHWRIQGGRQGRAPPPGGPNSFIFMQFSAKMWKIIAILGVGAPPWGKSWIRHWTPPADTLPPSRRLLQRTVCILLECFLVWQDFWRKLHENERNWTERGASLELPR